MRIFSLILMGIVAFVIGYYAHQAPAMARAAVPRPQGSVPLDHNPVGFTAIAPPPGTALSSAPVVTIRGAAHGCVSGKPCKISFNYFRTYPVLCTTQTSMADCTPPSCGSDDECIPFSGKMLVSHIGHKETQHSSETMMVKGLLVMHRP